jgi:hypothetical protein
MEPEEICLHPSRHFTTLPRSHLRFTRRIVRVHAPPSRSWLVLTQNNTICPRYPKRALVTSRLQHLGRSALCRRSHLRARSPRPSSRYATIASDRARRRIGPTKHSHRQMLSPYQRHRQRLSRREAHPHAPRERGTCNNAAQNCTVVPHAWGTDPSALLPQPPQPTSSSQPTRSGT